MPKPILVLDFDGVITNLDVDWNLVYNKVSDLTGYQIRGLIPFWEKYFGTELFRLCNKIIEDYELKAISRCRPFEDVKPAFEFFEGTIYVASMQSQKALEEFFVTNGLRQHLKEILGRDDFGSKPRQIRYIISKEKDHRHIVLVDDMQENVDVCGRLNIRTILFDRMRGDNLYELVKRL